MPTQTRTEALLARRRAVVARGVGIFAGDIAVSSARGATLVPPRSRCYTAMYRPRTGEAEYRWPHGAWAQSFSRFVEGEAVVTYRHTTAAADW